MVDESLRKPRRKLKASLHQLESPFPIPIQTITGRECTDKRWYYYFGTLQSDHISISRLGDLTFLYRLGFFGKGVFSRSQPQFEKYKDVLSDHGRKGYMQHFSVWEPEDRTQQQYMYTNIMNERLRQHASWVENEDEKDKQIDIKQIDDDIKENERKENEKDYPQCTDLHTDIDNLLVEECSSDSEDIDLYVIPTVEDIKKHGGIEESNGNKTSTITHYENEESKGGKTSTDIVESESDIITDNKLNLNNNGMQETYKIDIHTDKLKGGICEGKDIIIVDTSNIAVTDITDLDNISDTNITDIDNLSDTHIVDTNIADTNITDIDNLSDTHIVDTNIADTNIIHTTINNTLEEHTLKRPLSPVIEPISEKKIKLEDAYKLYECLQLTLEEAFFLSYGLGCLAVTDNNNQMTLHEMWDTFSTKQNNFIPIYAAYHHFRSKGWVVRFSKVYGSDFVLYQDGVAFHHASYCVNVHFVHEEKFSPKDTQLSWKQLSTMCRVNERAGKEVLLCYVIQPKDMTTEDLTSPSCIKRLKIMEVVLRRWSPEKFR